MYIIKMNPSLTTNVNLIDTQHAELFNRINNVVALGNTSTSKEETVTISL
ncbi:MAG: hypothetical protein FWG64_11585 [Firmicutes bacterium]|nr:hypothetical protein [Bacillota bacterium]